MAAIAVAVTARAVLLRALTASTAIVAIPEAVFARVILDFLWRLATPIAVAVSSRLKVEMVAMAAMP